MHWSVVKAATVRQISKSKAIFNFHISFFRSDTKGEQQLTREGKRRSSWHDLGSLFRQKESGSIDNNEGNQPTAENTDSAVCFVNSYVVFELIDLRYNPFYITKTKL